MPEIRYEALKPNSLDFLRAVYLNAELPLSVRMRAARDCLQYETPRLSVVASINDPNQFAERLERAIQRSGVRPLLLEHAPQPKPAPEPTSIAGPMLATERKGRRL